MKVHKEIYPIHASRLIILGGEVKVLIWIPHEKASTNQDGSDFWGPKDNEKLLRLYKISQKLINQMLRYLFFGKTAFGP